MYTQCPHCRTTFRIYPDQLAAARGQVRCGVCNDCFNALETLSEHLAPRPTAAATALPEMEAPQAGAAPAAVMFPAAGAAASPAASIAGEIPVTAVERPAEVEGTPAPRQAIAAPTPGTIELAAARKAAETAVPLSAQPDSALPDLGIIAAEPRPTAEAVEKKPGHWLTTALWAAVNVVLILTLTGQYAYYNRNELAQYPELRPWLSQLCAALRCDTPLRSDVSRIVLANRLVASDPNHPNALLIDATLVNNADFPQPYPLFELRFSDLNNQLVAGRRFRPSEYLPPGTALQAGMTPHQPTHIVLEIVDPGKNAVSFQFELL